MRTIHCIFLSAGLLLSVSCTKDDDNSITSISNTLSSGSWRITYFVDSGQDETGDFAGYDLTFSGNSNTVIASNGTNSVSGAWAVSNDGSNAELNLDFGTNDLFDDLNEDWHVLERTNVKVRMEHISGGGGGTDYLTLDKNQ